MRFINPFTKYADDETVKSRVTILVPYYKLDHRLDYVHNQTLRDKLGPGGYNAAMLSEVDKEVLRDHYGLDSNDNLVQRGMRRSAIGGALGAAAGLLGGAALGAKFRNKGLLVSLAPPLIGPYLGASIGSDIGAQRYSRENATRIMTQNEANDIIRWGR